MNILVVDDERDIRSLFEQRFRKEIQMGEAEFEFVRSGEEALNLLDNNHHVAFLILSDINMPGMSRLELLKRIRQKHHQPPPVVMMITAYGDAENFIKAMALGANDFITKPVDFSDLKDKIKSLN